MLILRDLLIFIAGIEFFHTLMHVYFQFFGQFPINLRYVELTSTMNFWAIIVNLLIVTGLLVLARVLKVKARKNKSGS